MPTTRAFIPITDGKNHIATNITIAPTTKLKNDLFSCPIEFKSEEDMLVRPSGTNIHDADCNKLPLIILSYKNSPINSPIPKNIGTKRELSHPKILLNGQEFANILFATIPKVGQTALKWILNIGKFGTNRNAKMQMALILVGKELKSNFMISLKLLLNT